MTGKALQLPPDQYSREDFMRILLSIDQRLTDLERSINETPVTVDNVTETRTFDAAAATLDDTRNMLGTLLKDLQNGGRLA